jgi:hypothetical protein
VYHYWDEVALNPPTGAIKATVDMLYQPTSWEYIQFLYLANDKQNAFLADQGDYILEAWLNTGMAAPHVMASAEWKSDTQALEIDADTVQESTGGKVNFSLHAGADNSGRSYFILGSVTGTEPGTPLPGGLTTLPLNWDAFTNLVMSLWNSPIFHEFMGQLDPSGRAAALFDTLGPLPGGSAGLVLYYAYTLHQPFDFVSNPVEITIVP